MPRVTITFACGVETRSIFRDQIVLIGVENRLVESHHSHTDALASMIS